MRVGLSVSPANRVDRAVYQRSGCVEVADSLAEIDPIGHGRDDLGECAQRIVGGQVGRSRTGAAAGRVGRVLHGASARMRPAELIAAVVNTD